MTSTFSTPRAHLDFLLSECVRQDASDLHLAPNLPPYYRLQGRLEAGEEPLSSEQLEALSKELLVRFDPTPLQRTGSVDGALTTTDGTRFRFNVFRRQGQLAIALRRLEDRFRTLQELGLPQSLHSLGKLPDGLIVVCGPTGAGKSTTLATLIDHINQTRRCHIVTIEDPIEYLHKPVQSLVNQRQVGSDTSSFNDALVASLRQDPDVILVGEIRDLNTIRTAITASETGHLVFTTVHAGDCVGAIERLVAVFPAEEQSGIRRQLSMVLRAVISQHLLICDGTDSTRNGHRRSRTAACEVLFNNGAIANLIATGKGAQIYSSIETGLAAGMQTLEQDLARLWVQGFISEQTALGMARNPALVRDRAALLRKSPIRPAGVPR